MFSDIRAVYIAETVQAQLRESATRHQDVTSSSTLRAQAAVAMAWARGLLATARRQCKQAASSRGGDVHKWLPNCAGDISHKPRTVAALAAPSCAALTSAATQPLSQPPQQLQLSVPSQWGRPDRLWSLAPWLAARQYSTSTPTEEPPSSSPPKAAPVPDNPPGTERQVNPSEMLQVQCPPSRTLQSSC